MKKIFLIMFAGLLLAAGCSAPAVRTPVDENVSNSQSSSVEYKNMEYGFSFSLIDSWKGFTIISGTWEAEGSDEKGRLLSIRHQLWTTDIPRQDIPIMVFTTAQWNDLQAGKFHVGAAPINPSELGRNGKYVFALPARYNFAFPAGFEEVQEMIDSKPLHVF